MPVDSVYDTHELAWAAGFWDGEGYTGAPPRTKNGQPQVHMKLGQSGSPELLERFQSAVGGLGYLQGPYKRVNSTTGKRYQDAYMWSTTKREHQMQVMCCLWPFLGDIKKAQMKESVLVARSWFNRGGDS